MRLVLRRRLTPRKEAPAGACQMPAEGYITPFYYLLLGSFFWMNGKEYVKTGPDRALRSWSRRFQPESEEVSLAFIAQVVVGSLSDLDAGRITARVTPFTLEEQKVRPVPGFTPDQHSVAWIRQKFGS